MFESCCIERRCLECITGLFSFSITNYNYKCNQCDAGYVGYARGHLHERVDGHKQKSSSICKHYLSEHNSDVPPFLSEQFHVLTKGSNKFDCLIKEMLFIRKLKPSLNVQADSIRARYSLEELVILCYTYDCEKNQSAGLKL